MLHTRPPHLLMPHIPDRPILIHVPDLRIPEAIQLPRTNRIQVNRKRERDEETHERDAHRDMIVLMICDEAGEGGEEGAPADAGDDPRGAALGVPAETADGEGEDGGEDAGLEEEDEGQHGDAGFAFGAHGGGDEDHDAGHEGHEDPAGFRDHHKACGGKATDGEETLADGVAVAAGGVGDLGRFDGIFDELRSDPDLGADVTKLGSDAEEEFVLLAHGLVDVAGQTGALFGLEGHVRVGDFGNRGEEEDDGEEEDEGCDTEVGPLDVTEISRVCVFEKDARSEERCHYGADCLEGLAELETEFGQTRGTTGGDEGVCRRFERGKTAANDEEGAAKAGEGAVDGRWPEHKGPDAVNAETGDEGPSVSKLADDEAGIGGRTDQICTKVGTLQSARFGCGDI